MSAATLPLLQGATGLPVVRAADLAADERGTAWLIDSLWLDQGVGVIGGAPKSCKSWLALDMATAIASGTPCLGRFEVPEPGRVLIYLAEDAQTIVRTRLEALCRHRGLTLDQLDVFAITADTVRLDLDADQRRLESTIARLRPRMLVLDPLVRLHRIDENSAGEVSGLLAYLRRMQRAYGVAVVLVHHSRKNGSATQPGQTLRGSGDLHAFGDSNLYLRRVHDRLVLTFEHRAAPPPEPVDLRLIDSDTPHLEVVGANHVAPDDTEQGIEAAILGVLCDHVSISAEAVRRQVRVRGTRLRRSLVALADRGLVTRDTAGWRLAPHLDPSQL